MPKPGVTVTNNMPAIMSRLRVAVQSEIIECAADCGASVSEGIQAGAYGLNRQSGAAQASIYVALPDGMAYPAAAAGEADPRIQSFNEAEANFAAHLIDEYGAHTGPEEADRLLMEEYHLKSKRRHIRAAVSSCALYLAFWEEGHMNKFTHQEEHRPQFLPAAHRARDTTAQRFIGILHKEG